MGLLDTALHADPPEQTNKARFGTCFSPGCQMGRARAP